jgi:hypothetical protein
VKRREATYGRFAHLPPHTDRALRRSVHRTCSGLRVGIAHFRTGPVVDAEELVREDGCNSSRWSFEVILLQCDDPRLQTRRK